MDQSELQSVNSALLCHVIGPVGRLDVKPFWVLALIWPFGFSIANYRGSGLNEPTEPRAYQLGFRGMG